MGIQDTFFMKFVVILSPSCVVFFRIVSNPGTILEVNLRRSPISKFKEALLSVICPAKKSVFGIHNPTGIKKTVSTAIGSQPIEKSHKKITVLLIHPPICASATLRLKIPNIYFVDALFSLFQCFF